MRSNLAPQLPKMGPMSWVLWNKLKVTMGGKVDFESYIDYERVEESPMVIRQPFLGQKVKDKVKLQKDLKTTDERYPLIKFVNR
jgi:hypothetical protein